MYKIKYLFYLLISYVKCDHNWIQLVNVPSTICKIITNESKKVLLGERNSTVLPKYLKINLIQQEHFNKNVNAHKYTA